MIEETKNEPSDIENPDFISLKNIINSDGDSDISVNDNILSKTCRLISSIIIFIFVFPFIFCDFYFAINDKSCVSQNLDKIYVNMYDYLLVSGIYGSITLIISIIIIFTYDVIDNNRNTFIYMYMTIFGYINKIINISWTIIGAVIFWSYMDNSICSKNVYNYIFASLIIRFVSIGLLLNTKDKKSDEN